MHHPDLLNRLKHLLSQMLRVLVAKSTQASMSSGLTHSHAPFPEAVGLIEEYKDPCISLRQLSRVISTRGLPEGLAESSYIKLIAVKSLPLLDQYHFLYFLLGVDSGRTSQ